MSRIGLFHSYLEKVTREEKKDWRFSPGCVILDYCFHRLYIFPNYLKLFTFSMSC